MIVADTNIVSELMKPAPAAAAVEWVRSCTESELYVTSITLAEVRHGIQRLPDGRRKAQLLATAEQIFAGFTEQVLSFDAQAATHYATIVCERDQLGLPIDGFDAQIAAICRAHLATLATRNLKDFRHTGIDLIDPWL